MNSCLNCGKEVKNKFCNVTCQNEFRGKEKIIEYNKTPKICISCGKPIEYKRRDNKFCSHSCSAKVSNVGLNRQRNFFDEFDNDKIIEFFNISKSVKDFFIKLGYKNIPSSERVIYVENKLKLFNIDISLLKTTKIPIKELTKKDLFNKRCNWQSARSAIVKDAKKTYNVSNKEKKCIICGYDKFYDISHIKPVSSFSDDSLISEINDINNLVALCGNHHYEFDNGLMEEKDLKKIQKNYV